MGWPTWLFALTMYAPLALLVFAPLSAVLARRRWRDAETWLLLGAVFGPFAVAWIAALPARPRRNDAEQAGLGRRRTPLQRIPTLSARRPLTCPLCGQLQLSGHFCRPEAVEDRISGRWTVRVGGQRIIGPPG
jgi:hypothetical protein